MGRPIPQRATSEERQKAVQHLVDLLIEISSEVPSLFSATMVKEGDKDYKLTQGEQVLRTVIDQRTKFFKVNDMSTITARGLNDVAEDAMDKLAKDSPRYTALNVAIGGVCSVTARYSTGSAQRV